MKRILLAVLLLAPMANAQPNLASYRDVNRVLLVFAPGANDPRYQQQLGLLTERPADLAERDLLLIPVFVQPSQRKESGTLPGALFRALSVAEQSAVRRRFRVTGDQFAALLLGKDGGEKFRSSDPVSVDRLNQLIDAMPMRQQEMHLRTH